MNASAIRLKQFAIAWALLLSLLLSALLPTAAHAEDGYDLWLRYRPVESLWKARYAPHVTAIITSSTTPTIEAARAELRRGISGMLGRTPLDKLRNGAILLDPRAHDPALGSEGYRVRSGQARGIRATTISANSDIGILYGAFALLRTMQTRQPIDRLDIRSAPKLSIRLLNHWDNLDGTVERGYAGASLWNWAKLPRIEPRLIDYARANASVGINGAVLNNVNADARVLTPEYLRKVAAIADAWRPYGIRVYLSVRFSAPIDIGGLKTADPVDPEVRNWWRAKSDEIYRVIPDFGGFLVKASSEGQPGPQTYGRGHAEGANMLADALAPHHGTLFWRAFVYSTLSQEDRAKQAYDEFKPLDGKFRANVILQVKNGPIDFQPREPFHPLFGQMPRTRIGLEVQITKEYLGESTHLAYLGTMWSEALRSRTSGVSDVANSIAALAGVANAGMDRNWTGSHFDQANWYAFGRLAWAPTGDPRSIAEEWTRMTWGNGPRMARPVVSMMMQSREAVVDYMTPLGLAHQMGTGHHYGPAPWVCDLAQPSWNPCYYSRADAQGIGFDRSPTGSSAIAQYAPEVARQFADSKTTPDEYLLWFHHVPWIYRMRSGRTLWDELVIRYDDGVASVEQANRTWASLRPDIDVERHAETAAKLRRQLAEARWWRDASIAYWQSLSNLPPPPGHKPAPHPLSWYEAIHFDEIPGFLAPRIPPGWPRVSTQGDPP
jgi:alpha-glucuronidase